jgi:hypothetical protein
MLGSVTVRCRYCGVDVPPKRIVLSKFLEFLALHICPRVTVEDPRQEKQECFYTVEGDQ